MTSAASTNAKTEPAESPLLREIQFLNLRALRDATLPLGRLTLLVGANGSGKTTALRSLALAAGGRYCDAIYGFTPHHRHLVSTGAENSSVSIQLRWNGEFSDARTVRTWLPDRPPGEVEHLSPNGDAHPLGRRLGEILARTRSYEFEHRMLARPVHIKPNIELAPNGDNLAALLERIRDQERLRWEALNHELNAWLPHYAAILFEWPLEHHKALMLETTRGDRIRADQLSSGELLSLALMALAYQPQPPKIVCIEDPDHGIHPRLLPRVLDSLNRLAFPENFGESREPTQVIATTHSPYFVDLFKDSPEDLVVAERGESGVTFQRVVDRDHFDDIIGDAPLGEVWYSGILGGVPSHT